MDEDGQEVDYANSNYYGKRTDYLSAKQLAWIENLLKEKNKHYIFFSHTPMDGVLRDNKSFSLFRGILNKAQTENIKIIAVISGHHHLDYYSKRDGINYFQLNSASYLYVGDKYTNTTRYPQLVYEKRKTLAATAPYQKVLFANLTLDSKKQTLRIKGTKSTFIPPSPKKLGVPNKVNNLTGDTIHYTPYISSVQWNY